MCYIRIKFFVENPTLFAFVELFVESCFCFFLLKVKSFSKVQTLLFECLKDLFGVNESGEN